jgi:hypothetical protein
MNVGMNGQQGQNYAPPQQYAGIIYIRKLLLLRDYSRIL